MKRFLILLLSVFTLSCASVFGAEREQQLKIYNWADYIDEALLEEFEVWYEEQTGEKIEIIYQLFDVNEIMLSKIEKGHEDFDVVCPSDYIIERMLKSNLLLPIDKDFGSTPNYIDNVAPYLVSLLNQVDGGDKNANDYAVPYMWGTVGIMYNPKYVSDEEVRSWDVMKDPKYQGKLLMKEAFRDVYTSLNIALNHDAIKRGERSLQEVSYDTSKEAIERVEAYMNEVKPNIAGWEADFGKEMMTKEKAWMNLSWSGDAQWAIEEAEAIGVELDYAIPESGSTVWFDGWVIPKYARNVKAARYFINYMCMVENALRNMDVIGYVSAVGGDEILEAQSDSGLYEAHDVSYFFGEAGKNAYVNDIQYPDAAIIANCGMMHDKGTDELLAMWKRLKGDNASGSTFVVLGLLLLMAAASVIVTRRRKNRHKRRRRRR